MKTIRPLPENYLTPMEQGGQILRLDYQTAYNAYGLDRIDKYAYVYLPYDYDDTKPYNILYCLHGGGGEIEVFFGDGTYTTDFKNTLDHMIANGDIPPIIAVSPTYYGTAREQTLESALSEIKRFCRVELIDYLIPAVENRFSTYSRTVDREGLRLSREHRACAGFSMGAHATWCSCLNAMDYFKYFLPMSGDCWVDKRAGADKAARLLSDAASHSKYGKDDIFIHAITGDKDIAYIRMKNMLDALEENNDFFTFASDDVLGNICFSVEPDAIHDYKYMPLYIYNVLPEFFSHID